LPQAGRSELRYTMKLNAYFFAVLAAIIMGTAPLFGRLGLVHVEPLIGLGIRLFVASSILLVYFFVTGQIQHFFSLPATAVGFFALEGLFAALLGHLFYFYALKSGEISKVVPIVTSAPLVAVLWGIFFLGESLNAFKILGIMLVVGGIILLRFA